MFRGLAQILKHIQNEKHWHSDKKDAALNSIRTALQATKVYVIQLDNGAEEDKEKELELSDLWSQASVVVRHLDPELAQRLGDKGNYWLEPYAWTVDDIYEAKIKLERIEIEFRELL